LASMRAKTQVVAPARVTPIALPLRSATPRTSGATLSVKWLPSVWVATVLMGEPASRNTRMSVEPVTPTRTSPAMTALSRSGPPRQRRGTDDVSARGWACPVSLTFLVIFPTLGRAFHECHPGARAVLPPMLHRPAPSAQSRAHTPASRTPLPNERRAPGSGHPRCAPASRTPLSMTDAPVGYEVRDGVAWITLNRPRVLNALDTDLAATLADHAEAAAADPDVTLVVVRGAGR